MSAALIKADMFSNSPQERPGETVSKKEKKRPQTAPCNISSPRQQMSPGGRKLLGSLDQKKCHSFLWAFFEASQGMLLYQFDLIDPIRLLGFSSWNGLGAETLLISDIKVDSNKSLFGFMTICLRYCRKITAHWRSQYFRIIQQFKATFREL